MGDELKVSAEGTEPKEETSEQEFPSDELVDQMSDELRDEGESETVAELTPEEMVLSEGSEAGEGEGEEELLELEEEKIKDEVDIQIDLLQDQDWVVRREAVITLGEMADERCVEPLVRCLRDGDWQVREAAVDAVEQVGSPAVEMLLHYLRDWEARKYVLRAMGKIPDERVLDPLISMLKNDEFKDDATRALVELGKPAVEKLVMALSDKEDFVKKQAILALGDIKDPAAVDPLIALLQDQDWFVRLTAAAALEKIGDLRGRDAVKALMKDPDLVVRMRVERIMAAWKKPSSKQPANA
jgi:HEAT repeat protein